VPNPLVNQLILVGEQGLYAIFFVHLKIGTKKHVWQFVSYFLIARLHSRFDLIL